MDHHFNTEIAKKYSVNEAIMLHNLCFWQNRNIANNNNFHEEKFWVYNSVDAFSKLFFYLSPKQITLILKKLETNNCVFVGRFNKMKIDRTKWYSVNDEIMAIHGFEANCPKREMQQPEKVNAITQKGKCNNPKGQKEEPKKAKGITQKGEPIPYNKPDNNNLIINTNKNTYRAFAHLSLSELEFDKLLLNNTKEEIDEILDSIENYNKNKNYKSLFLTTKSWLKKSFSKEKRSSENLQESNYEKIKKVRDNVIQIIENGPEETVNVNYDPFAPVK